MARSRADLHSHVNVALGVFRPVCQGLVADPLKRAKAAGILLESVTRGRTDDYASAVGFMAAVPGRQDQELLASGKERSDDFSQSPLPIECKAVGASCPPGARRGRHIMAPKTTGPKRCGIVDPPCSTARRVRSQMRDPGWVTVQNPTRLHPDFRSCGMSARRACAIALRAARKRESASV